MATGASAKRRRNANISTSTLKHAGPFGHPPATRHGFVSALSRDWRPVTRVAATNEAGAGHRAGVAAGFSLPSPRHGPPNRRFGYGTLGCAKPNAVGRRAKGLPEEKQHKT